MADVTQILNAIEAGDPHAAAQLLRLAYDDLRRLAAQRMDQVAPGQTLDALNVPALTEQSARSHFSLAGGPGGDS